ncbi:MAG: response regulator [Planctomycetes bacterium]|nr:response regulator [Planctomycetota bacterium]
MDDSSTNREIVEGYLVAAGYSVLQAEGGARALELYSEGGVDLVLLDVMMPQMDGKEACCRLRALPGGEGLPIVFLTALDEGDITRELFSVGADDFLTKPVRRAELLLRVKSLLRIQQLQRSLQDSNVELRTYSRRQTRRLDDSRRRFETLARSSPVGIFQTGLDGRCLYVNERWSEICGETAGVALGSAWTSMLRDEDRVRADAEWAQAFAEERNLRFEGQVARGGRWVAVQVAPELATDGSRCGFVGTLADITELHEAREEERATAELLRAISRAQTAFILGADSRHLFAELLTDLLQLTSSEYGFIGQVHYGPDDSPYLLTRAITNIAWDDETRDRYDAHAHSGMRFANLRTLFGAVMTTKALVVSNDPANDPRSGGLPPGHPPLAAFLGLPLTKGSKLVGMIGLSNRPGGYDSALIAALDPIVATCANIFDAIDADLRREEAAQALERSEERLRHSEKMEAVGKVAAGVAHDFNNMLSVILGYSQMALGKLQPGHAARRAIQQVQRAGERSASITRQLLAFSRKQTLSPQRVELSALTQDVAWFLRRVVRERVEIKIDASPPTYAVLDPAQLEHALLNLAVNASDAMPEGGSLTIATARVDLDPAEARRVELEPGSFAVVSITDTGTGIPPETLLQIFDPFFTTKEVGEGTGLGLASVHGFVKQSGGSVGVESALGEGTSFRLYFPLAAGDSEVSSQPGPAQLRRGSGTVALAEDEPLVCSLLEEVLVSAGYLVLAADCAEALLARVRTHEGEIDLLVTDMVMPGLGGRELGLRMRGEFPDVKVIYLSGYIDELVETRSGEVFLPKPVTPHAFLAAIDDLLTAV